MNRQYPKNHPLCDAPDDIIAIAIIAEMINTTVADIALKARLAKLAENGDRKAKLLIEVAEYLSESREVVRYTGKGKIKPQVMIENDENGSWVPETLSMAAVRLVRYALTVGELNKKMVDTFFGVGLIGKAERDQFIAAARLAA